MHIPRELIDEDADKVVRRLSRHGYQAYLVGGCVRDLLLGRVPKDFDVATSATPKEIRRLFRNCRIIGRRFTLAHIFFGPKIIETSTFRANPREGLSEADELLIRRDNVFGSDTEDAQRRDFTINGLFYDIEEERVIDHVSGLPDLESRLVRTIGNANIRFREDPVRMLRAVKFAARLDFDVSDETYQAILRHRGEINKCAAPRVLEEVYRLLKGSAARRSMKLLLETGLGAMLSTRLTALFGGGIPQRHPTVEGSDEEAQWQATWADELAAKGPSQPQKIVELQPTKLELSFVDEEDVDERRRLAWAMLDHLDARHDDVSGAHNSFILAALSIAYVNDVILDHNLRPAAVNAAIVELLDPLVTELRVARRDAERARQLLLSQRRLVPSRKRRGKPHSFIQREYFGDALLLAEMFARVRGGDPEEILSPWRKLVEQEHLGIDGDRPRKRRRRRRGGRGRRKTATLTDELLGG
jgi:poly(A) polymerase